MKKLLLAAVLVALVAGAWAQPDFTSTTSPRDTVYLKMNVHMVGFQFTFTMVDEEGNCNTAGGYDGTWAAMGGASLDTIEALDDEIKPCNVAHLVGWVENTGGITMDLDVWFVSDADTVTTPWTRYDVAVAADPPVCSEFGSTANGEDKIILDYYVGASDGSEASPACGSVGWVELSMTDAGAASEATDIYAEDFDTPGDGTFGTEDDQREVHFGIVFPTSSSNTNVHILKWAIQGEIATGS